MNCPAMPPGGGSGIKFRKPFRPKTRKITPARYRAIAETVLINRVLLWNGQSFDCPNHIDVKIIDDVYLLKIQVFYDPRHSSDGPRLARHDEGDARPDEVRSRWYRRDRSRPFGFRRAGSTAAQRAFAGQYDRPNRRSDARLDQYRCRPPRR